MQQDQTLGGKKITLRNGENTSLDSLFFERFKALPTQYSFSDLYNPYNMKDMDKAVKRIREAQNQGERVMIF